ncbi:MAG: response regulator [Candidatus Cloacimonetes bacterium]|nr:response regulator [Candidatus Cloacimonadota bacterium]MCK9242866.1 response regulator [Candidatus Cloacimonadota bacterium]
MDIKHYQALIQQIPFGFAYHRILRDESGKVTDYRFLEANAELGRLTGLDPAQIKGKTVREVQSEIGKADFDWLSFYEQLDIDQKVNEYKQYSEPLGYWYQVRISATDKDLFTVFFFDLPKLIEPGQKLYSNKDLFHLLIQSSKLLVAVLDDKLKVIYPECLVDKLCQIELSHVVDENILARVHPDDLESAQDLIKWLREHPAQTDTREIRARVSQESYTWLEVIGSNMLDFPDVNGFVFIMRDISQRKAAQAALLQSENRLRYITNNVRDMVFLTDKDLNTIYISPSVQEILGESPKQRIEKKLEEKFTPKSLELLHKILRQELLKDADTAVDKDRSRIVELEQYKADGSILDISMHISILRDENGKFNGLQGVSRDITQQKRIEQELAENIKYIDSLLNAIPDLMFVVDEDGIISDIKSGHEESLYMPKEQILNSHISDILPKNLAKSLLQKKDEALETRKTVYMQYQLMIEGGLEDYEVSISPFGDRQVIALARNITQQQQAISALQQQNQFQTLITEISTAFVKATMNNIDQVLYDSLARVGQYFAIHRAYIFRYSQDFSMLYNTNEWDDPELKPIPGQKKVYPSSNTPWWHQQIMAGNMILTEDKQELPAEARAEYLVMERFGIGSLLFVPIQTGSRVLGYFGFDSIGQKRSFSESEIGNLKVISNLLAEVLQKFDYERKMQDQAHLQELISGMALRYINLPTSELQVSIYDSLSELATFVDADRAYIFEYDWDRQICTNTSEWCGEGISPQKDNLQKVPLSEMQDWAEQHKAGENVILRDLKQLDEHGGLRKILASQNIKSAIALPMMSGEECLGFVGFDFVRTNHIYLDTERTLLKLFAQLLVNTYNRKNLEERLIREKERAEAANRAKSDFLANMSHEIRTPLNGVIGFTELMLNSSLSHTQQQYAHNIVHSSYSLLGIVSDILDFSKIEAGKLELDLVRTDLIKLLEHVMDIIKVKTSKKNIELLLNIPMDLPRFVILDPLRLNQVLFNLLSNAEKFTKAGEIELKLSFTMKGKKHADIRFAVRDTGIGIAETQKRKLFQAFSQLDSSTTRKYGGTGLGLVISNHLTKLMGSEIELSSTVNQGSEFFFVLNCQVETPTREERYAPSNIQKALIIVDNASNRSILKNLLGHWEIASTAFASSIRAMKHLQDQRDYDIIVLDHQMPGLGGIPTIKMIRQQMPAPLTDCPIILLLNTSDDEAIQKAVQELKIRYTLVKPVKAQELMNLLKVIDTKGASSVRAKEAKIINKIPTIDFDKAPRILIAEDNSLNLTLLKEMIHLQIPGAQIITAVDGLEAVDQVKKHAPHIVLMDVQMPNLDGVNASVEIRKFSDVPIIAVTAGTLDEERERCLNGGMSGFLTKPVLVDKLRDTLARHLSLSLITQPKEQDISSPEDTNKHFDKTALLKKISGDTQIFNSLLETVLNSFPGKIRDIKAAMDKDDEAQIKAALHALRGSAQNMHFTELGQRAEALERSYTEIYAEKRQALYQKIESEWYKVRKIISQIISEDLPA